MVLMNKCAINIYDGMNFAVILTQNIAAVQEKNNVNDDNKLYFPVVW